MSVKFLQYKLWRSKLQKKNSIKKNVFLMEFYGKTSVPELNPIE